MVGEGPDGHFPYCGWGLESHLALLLSSRFHLPPAPQLLVNNKNPI